MHEKSDRVCCGKWLVCEFGLCVCSSVVTRSFDVNAFRSLKLNYKPKQFQMNSRVKKAQWKKSYIELHFAASPNSIMLMPWENFQ